MITQLHELFLWLHQRNKKCRLALISLRRGKDSPMEAGKKLFGDEFGGKIVPDERVFCFLLMVGRHDGLALRVITDLRKKKGQRGKISVDEALLVMEDDEMDEHCRFLAADTLKKLETMRIKRQQIKEDA